MHSLVACLFAECALWSASLLRGIAGIALACAVPDGRIAGWIWARGTLLPLYCYYPVAALGALDRLTAHTAAVAVLPLAAWSDEHFSTEEGSGKEEGALPRPGPARERRGRKESEATAECGRAGWRPAWRRLAPGAVAAECGLHSCTGFSPGRGRGRAIYSKEQGEEEKRADGVAGDGRTHGATDGRTYFHNASYAVRACVCARQTRTTWPRRLRPWRGAPSGFSPEAPDRILDGRR